MRNAFALSIILATLTGLMAQGEELDFGDRTSVTLTGKAWKALADKNYKDAVTYSKMCVELFEKQAVEMQKELKEPVPQGDNDAIHKKGALNDVGTCLYIMGQALEKQEKNAEALAAYKQLTEKVPFAQCWDPQGWFWKPAAAAKDRIKALEPVSPQGAELDFGDLTSPTLTGKAWKSLADNNYKNAVAYSRKCVELFEKQAVEMQKELKEPVPEGDNDAIHKKGALNDVGTCLYIMGQALEKQEKNAEALAAYKQLTGKVPFAQCWDPQGWFWKPAAAAEDRIKALEPVSPK
jgi:tetratricopeptide (TPR) repeat protein